jgi:hypothetical protein
MERKYIKNENIKGRVNTQRPKEKINKMRKERVEKLYKIQKRRKKGRIKIVSVSREQEKRNVKPPGADMTKPQVMEPNVYNSVPIKSVLSLMNNFRVFIKYSSKLRFSIVFPSPPTFSKRSLFLAELKLLLD